MATAVRTTMSASTLIGDDVRNPAGENLGSIKEIMFDVNSGRIAYAVLSFGGLLGVGDKLFAVPWTALQLNTTDHNFMLDIDQSRLEAAEGFDKENWPDMSDQTWGARIHEFYDVRPYWQA